MVLLRINVSAAKGKLRLPLPNSQQQQNIKVWINYQMIMKTFDSSSATFAMKKKWDYENVISKLVSLKLWLSMVDILISVPAGSQPMWILRTTPINKAFNLMAVDLITNIQRASIARWPSDLTNSTGWNLDLKFCRPGWLDLQKKNQLWLNGDLASFTFVVNNIKQSNMISRF